MGLIIELMCSSCHDFFEIFEKDYDESERPLCLECETAIKGERE